jgi:hypothetical protein
VAENDKARRYFGTDPVRLIYKRLIRVTIDLLAQDWPDMPNQVKVAFVFDEHQRWREAEEEYQRLTIDDPACTARMLTVSHADDKDTIGLQMADLAAWEARLKTMRWMSGSPIERAQFRQMARNENIYFVAAMTRDNLLAELRDAKEKGLL